MANFSNKALVLITTFLISSINDFLFQEYLYSLFLHDEMDVSEFYSTLFLSSSPWFMQVFPDGIS